MEFEGVYPAIITPLDKTNSFKEEEFRKVVEFNIQAGVHGFWVSGGTGESVYVKPEDIKKVIKSAIDQSNDRAKIIAHSSEAMDPIYFTKAPINAIKKVIREIKHL